MPAPDRKRGLTAFAAAMAILIATPLAVVAADAFNDVPDSNVHHEDITWLRDNGVTFGCNPPANTEFCPGDPVLRQQMASFMRRLAENRVVDAATAVEANHAATADDADNVDGVAAVDLVPGGTLPAGSTVRGTLNVGGTAAAAFDLATSDVSYGYDMGAALQVEIIDDGDPPPAECPGTAAAPEAAPGHLCIYSMQDNNTDLGFNTSHSFGVTVFARADAAGDFFTIASWAATAPEAGTAGAPDAGSSPNNGS